MDPARPASRTTISLVVEQRALPTNYILGYYSGPLANTEDYHALRIATSVLTGRMFSEIRTRQNLTYDVHAPFLDRAASAGGLYVSTASPDTTLKLMHRAVRELQEGLLDPDGLQRLERQFLTEYFLDNETNDAQANFLARAQLYRGDYRTADRFVEELKAHAGILQIVQERVPLRRMGTSWKGLCPFHGEKTPSFVVHDDKGYFHCFGCGVGGDVIKFVELYDKVSFPDAVRQLAARVGLSVPEAQDPGQDAESQREREALLKLHEVAAAWFREQLQGRTGATARRLVETRGLTGETVDLLGIGYAPAAPEGLKARLLKEGFTQPTLLKSGLVVQRDNGTVLDRFRNRLMIPIYRDNGAVVDFGGRAAFVGDSIIDADTARAAGLPFVAVSFGFADRPVEQLGADAVIDDFAALAEALSRCAAR